MSERKNSRFLFKKYELLVIATYLGISMYGHAFLVLNPEYRTGFLRDLYKSLVLPIPTTMIAICIIALFAPPKRFWIFFGLFLMTIYLAFVFVSGLRVGFNHTIVYYAGILELQASLKLVIPACLIFTIYQRFWGIHRKP